MKNVERLQNALLTAEREYLDPRFLTERDLDILEAMDYQELYGDMGAQVTDKVSTKRFHEMLLRAQIQPDSYYEEISDLIDIIYMNWCGVSDSKDSEYIEDILDVPAYEFEQSTDDLPF